MLYLLQGVQSSVHIDFLAARMEGMLINVTVPIVEGFEMSWTRRLYVFE